MKIYTLVVKTFINNMPEHLHFTDHWIFNDLDKAYEVAERLKHMTMLHPDKLEESCFKQGRLVRKRTIIDFNKSDNTE